ncbi:MAG: DMT family transporter [Bacillota bacterium]
MTLTALTVACLAGILMAVQGVLNSGLGRIAGLLKATLAVHAAGLAVIAPVVLLYARQAPGRLTGAPWFYYLGGPLGVGIVYFVAASIGRVGACPATTAIITGQVLTAAALDHFGVLGLQRVPFHPFKLLGVAFLSFGAWILLKR